jgi:hypothetical protein
MLVDYTMVLNRSSVSVKGPTQQGIESVMEMTPACSARVMGLAIHASGSGSSERSVQWLELPPASSPSPSGLLQQLGCPMVAQGASLAEVQGKEASQTPPTAKAKGKCPATPAPTPGVGAPAPRAGNDAVSPGDWTDLRPCDVGDAPPGKKAKRGSQT